MEVEVADRHFGKQTVNLSLNRRCGDVRKPERRVRDGTANEELKGD